MLGWTALPFALTLLVLGAVMMLRHRAGYWSAEALVGAELLLLCAMTLTYLWRNQTINWAATVEGHDGGVVGWATGSLLAASLGRWPAILLVLGLAFIGLVLLVRYTPLVYGAHYAGRLFPVLPAVWEALADWMPRRGPHDDELDPHYGVLPSAAFVTADGEMVMDELFAETPTRPRVRAAKATQKAANKGKTPQAGKKPTAPKPLRNADDLPPIDLLDSDSGDYTSATCAPWNSSSRRRSKTSTCRPRSCMWRPVRRLPSLAWSRSISSVPAKAQGARQPHRRPGR